MLALRNIIQLQNTFLLLLFPQNSCEILATALDGNILRMTQKFSTKWANRLWIHFLYCYGSLESMKDETRNCKRRNNSFTFETISCYFRVWQCLWHRISQVKLDKVNCFTKMFTAGHYLSCFFFLFLCQRWSKNVKFQVLRTLQNQSSAKLWSYNFLYDPRNKITDPEKLNWTI